LKDKDSELSPLRAPALKAADGAGENSKKLNEILERYEMQSIRPESAVGQTHYKRECGSYLFAIAK
jgi:hypothetical protein